MSLVASHPGGEACVCDLNEAFDLSQPTISHHLKVLHEAGLLDRDKRGVWVYYRARLDALASLGTLIGDRHRLHRLIRPGLADLGDGEPLVPGPLEARPSHHLSAAAPARSLRPRPPAGCGAIRRVGCSADQAGPWVCVAGLGISAIKGRYP